MKETTKTTDEVAKRRRFINAEIERIRAISPQNVLPEVLPFVRDYERQLRDELKKLEQ